MKYELRRKYEGVLGYWKCEPQGKYELRPDSYRETNDACPPWRELRGVVVDSRNPRGITPARRGRNEGRCCVN